MNYGKKVVEMIRKISKKDYDRIRWLMQHHMNQGRRVMLYKEKYYETTGSKLNDIAKWQNERRKNEKSQLSLIE